MYTVNSNVLAVGFPVVNDNGVNNIIGSVQRLIAAVTIRW